MHLTCSRGKDEAMDTFKFNLIVRAMPICPCLRIEESTKWFIEEFNDVLSNCRFVFRRKHYKQGSLTPS